MFLVISERQGRGDVGVAAAQKGEKLVMWVTLTATNAVSGWNKSVHIDLKEIGRFDQYIAPRSLHEKQIQTGILRCLS